MKVVVQPVCVHPGKVVLTRRRPGSDEATPHPWVDPKGDTWTGFRVEVEQ